MLKPKKNKLITVTKPSLSLIFLCLDLANSNSSNIFSPLIPITLLAQVGETWFPFCINLGQESFVDQVVFEIDSKQVVYNILPLPQIYQSQAASSINNCKTILQSKSSILVDKSIQFLICQQGHSYIVATICNLCFSLYRSDNCQ